MGYYLDLLDELHCAENICTKIMVFDIWEEEWGSFESDWVCFCLCFVALLGHFERSTGVVQAGRGGGGLVVVFFVISRVSVHGIVGPSS